MQWRMAKNVVGILALAVLSALTAAGGATEKVLFNFDYDNGSLPQFGPLVADSTGHLYGTTEYGGGSPNCTLGCGEVFQLTRGSNGLWAERVIYAFTGRPDGAIPQAGLAIDLAGNLYGTTVYGGVEGCTSTAGCGTVFRLTKGSNGVWSEQVLHSFYSDGIYPNGPVTLDQAGNVYGTTYYGGSSPNCYPGCGTVFKLAANTWALSTLYSFTGTPDGANPWAVKLVFDSTGSLYGTTEYGGNSANCTNGCGTVFRLTPTAGGVWTEKVIHSFSSYSDGAIPASGVIIHSGHVYGTTVYGGGSGNCTLGCGVVFSLTPNSTGIWSERVVYSFTAAPDGSLPYSSLVSDAAGNLYGTTFYGGASQNCTTGCGTVFEVSPGTNGIWTENVLYSFTGNPDASNPASSLILDPQGDLYGTTVYGGSGKNCLYGCGAVFEIIGR